MGFKSSEDTKRHRHGKLRRTSKKDQEGRRRKQERVETRADETVASRSIPVIGKRRGIGICEHEASCRKSLDAFGDLARKTKEKRNKNDSTIACMTISKSNLLTQLSLSVQSSFR